MEILDGDEAPLISSIGQKRTRDLVQFVSFSKFQNDEKKLAEEVLAEIPKQIVEYYKFKNLNPNQIQQLLYQNNQYNNNNFNQYNINGNNNNYENYPSLEELQKKNDIDLNNLPINETVVLNPNNIK